MFPFQPDVRDGGKTMQKQHFLRCALAFSSIPLLAGFFQQASFNVKPGLWEGTSVSHTTGTPPMSDDMKARLTPEQQERLAAAIAASGARAAQPHTIKVCMSRDKMDRGLDPDRPNCTRTVVTNTPTVLEVREECTGDMGKTLMTFHYQALNQETVNGKTHVEITRAGQTMVSDGTIQGKWVSDSCGDVK
jgi:Protein of unknown function (DUF3617)